VHEHAAQALVIMNGQKATPRAWADLTQVVLPIGHLNMSDKTKYNWKVSKVIKCESFNILAVQKNVYILDEVG